MNGKSLKEKPKVKTSRAKAPAAEKKTASRKVAPAPAVSIDYPQEGEQILPGHYAIRLASSLSGPVEIRIDGGEWIACRSELGYYWYDWWPTEAGEHTIEARSALGTGSKKGASRSCLVMGPSAS